jgi:methyl-accepting chemotaxis protein
VEEQNATAREIAQRVVGSAQEARTIVDSLEELKGVALESAESARRSSESSSRIAQMASDLDRATAAFSAG